MSEEFFDESMRLFLCGILIFKKGDLMLGRGIDQILPYPSKSTIYESYVKDANDYVKLAVKKNGEIPEHNFFEYIWGKIVLNEFDYFKVFFFNKKSLN